MNTKMGLSSPRLGTYTRSKQLRINVNLLNDLTLLARSLNTPLSAVIREALTVVVEHYRQSNPEWFAPPPSGETPKPHE